MADEKGARGIMRGTWVRFAVFERVTGEPDPPLAARRSHVHNAIPD